MNQNQFMQFMHQTRRLDGLRDEPYSARSGNFPLIGVIKLR